MAEQLIDRFSGRFRPEKYKDTYTDALKKIVRAKQRGKAVEVAPEREEPEVPDLMEALRASLETSKTSRGRSTRKSTQRKRQARKAA